MRARHGRPIRAAGVALAAALVVGTSGAAGAQAAGAREVRSLCAERATLKSTPGGIVIAHLRRPQRLVLEARTPGGAWAYVRTRAGTRGWILSARLCAR